MLCKLFQPGAKENWGKFKNSAFTRSERKVFVLILMFFMFLAKNILKILIAINKKRIKACIALSLCL